MASVWRNRRVWQGAAVVAVLLAVALWPRAIAVDAAAVSRGPLVVTIDEEGETRVHHRFLVSAPVSGRVDRIELEPGDLVQRGVTVVARLRPEAPQLLDARSRVEAQAAVETARGTLGRARADEQRARAALDLATRELKREEELYRAGATTAQSLESRRSALVTTEETLNAATFATAAANAELDRARARLMPTSVDATGRVLEVRAPVDG
ncbi:MAG: RND transporter, partial [Acidobacteria bacterium]|nr:RND transporter [Acidobacteriota bacterium]